MVINRPGAEFYFNGIRYVIGHPIIATDESEYEGLFGTITEIRTLEDKETENDTPDFYCAFDEPELPSRVHELEEVFSELYREPKKMEDITLDYVIMSPEMVRPIPDVILPTPGCKVYVILEEWAVDDDQGTSLSTAYTDRDYALLEMQLIIRKEKNEGCIDRWVGNSDFIEESMDTQYECYLDGFWLTNHYRVSVIELGVNATEPFVRSLAADYKKDCLLEDFDSQIEQWDEVSDFTPEQYYRLLHDPDVADKLQHAISNNDSYWEAYWQSISEAGHDLIRDFRKKNGMSEKPNVK